MGTREDLVRDRLAREDIVREQRRAREAEAARSAHEQQAAEHEALLLDIEKELVRIVDLYQGADWSQAELRTTQVTAIIKKSRWRREVTGTAEVKLASFHFMSLTYHYNEKYAAFLDAYVLSDDRVVFRPFRGTDQSARAILEHENDDMLKWLLKRLRRVRRPKCHTFSNFPH